LPTNLALGFGFATRLAFHCCRSTVTAPTNGQVQVQDTRGNHTICHSDFEHNEYRALERVSRGPAAGQAIMRAQRARGSQVANTKGEAIVVNGNSFRRGQSIGGHSVTQGKRCFEAMTIPSATGPPGFLYYKPVPNSFSRGALAPWHQGTGCATGLGQKRHIREAHDNSFCASDS